MSTPPALELSNVVKHYGNSPALRGINLRIERGDFFGFLGPNGAGKSTAIHLITGIGRMESGTIKVFGFDVVRDHREARRRVGLSPQEFNVDIFEKVESILDYMAGYYGMPKAVRKERIEVLLRQFDLLAHRTKEFRMLSGGLKRRVMLARAMVHDPDLLILDEPTAGVDVELRRELWGYLQEVNKAGKTILLTSHYLEEVELLCNTIAILHDGKILEAGSKSDLMRGEKLEERYLSITKAAREHTV
jgi:ABC-2 type transport system ATP-binding protein